MLLLAGTTYHFQVRAVNTYNGPESDTASGVATAVAADWTFKIETLDGDGNVTTNPVNLVAGETELTLRFTATYTVATADRAAASQACGPPLKAGI